MVGREGGGSGLGVWGPSLESGMEFCGQMGISNLFLTVCNLFYFFLFYRQSQVRGCLKPQNKFGLVTFEIVEIFEVELNSFC